LFWFRSVGPSINPTFPPTPRHIDRSFYAPPCRPPYLLLSNPSQLATIRRNIFYTSNIASFVRCRVLRNSKLQIVFTFFHPRAGATLRGSNAIKNQLQMRSSTDRVAAAAASHLPRKSVPRPADGLKEVSKRTMQKHTTMATIAQRGKRETMNGKPTVPRIHHAPNVRNGAAGQKD